MGTVRLHLDPWGLAWRGLCQRLAPPRCGLPDCTHAGNLWRLLRGTPPRILIQGARYCVDGCLERVLTDLLGRLQRTPKRKVGPRRIPLGLLLLSRQQLTAEQLQAALGAQRAAGCGRIGEWLQALGFVNEQQVTTALARQWSCPVLRSESLMQPAFDRMPQIPVALLESHLMIPIAYVEATNTLHIAFAEGIDYSVLYAMEQMLGCRTEPCLAAPTLLRRRLRALSEQRGESEILFDRVADAAEFARIVQSYSVRVAAGEMRIAACGGYAWVRLLRPFGRPLDLLFCTPRESATPSLPAATVAAS
ncbi:MAG TPA: hypothetical protein VEH47_04955 [Candidatus Acidoferrales bacterium]|nr:hypothetical protein [Candidatus Acidoferrales bacterium]